MNSSKILVTFTLLISWMASVSSPPVLAQTSHPVYFFQPSDLKMDYVPDGAHFTWVNQDAASKEAAFSQVQNVEGLNKISFDLDITQNTNTALQVGFSNRYDNSFVYNLSSAETATGRKTVEIPLNNFMGNYSGLHGKGDEILIFWVKLSGGAAQFAGTLSHFTVQTTHNIQLHLFDAAVQPDPFPPSFLYPGSLKPRFVGERKPRVIIAQGSTVLSREQGRPGIERLGALFPGAFGLDFNTNPTSSNQQAVRYYNDRGIKTIFEGHKTVNQYTTYLTYHNFFLQNSEGQPGNIPGHGLFPYHGEDTTIPEVVAVSKAKIDEVAREGFSEFLLIDYTWPWNGRWGYGPPTVRAFVKDLNATDSGISMRDARGAYPKQTFWNYLRLFTDVPFAPADLGLVSWDNYQPVAEKQASNGNLPQKKNFYLFHALWHYEYLKYLQQLGDYAASKGILFYPTVNGEDPMNGTDLYVMANLRHVAKIGYEYFGSPGGTLGWYHTMRWYSDNFQQQGKDISMIGEINGGGNGPTRYNWDVAYAFYYDLTSAAKPIDYNNQYMEGMWADTPKTDLYQFPRYAHWYAGALGFMQSHREHPALQPAKKTVLVASRGVLEYQPGFNSLAQTGNLALLLDQLHIPFDAAGKEGFAAFAKNATNLVYCPAESSPMHMKALKQWLAQGAGKTLIMQSLAPFSFSNGTLGLNPGLTADLTWAGKANWNDFQKAETLSVNRDLAMILKRINNQVLTLSVNGQTASAQRDVYKLDKAPDAQTVFASNEGVPLISRLRRGANSILYIHARLGLPDFTAKTDFDRLLMSKAMSIAGIIPEAQSPPQTMIHLYDVAGGHSAVLWDSPTIAAQDPKNYYARLALDKPIICSLKVKANTPYIVYHFYENRTQVARSDAEGNLPLDMKSSNELFYYGEAGDALFQQTLAQARQTRKKLAGVEPEPIPPDATSLQAASNNAPDNAEFLVFSGGMALANKGLTDGTTVTFKYRAAGGADWKTLGKHNFQDVYEDDKTLYALPLNGVHPQEIMMIVSMNSNPSFDATYISNLAVMRKNGQVAQRFVEAKERGLWLGTHYDADATRLQSSGATVHHDAQTQRWICHPAYQGVLAPVYAIFTVPTATP